MTIFGVVWRCVKRTLSVSLLITDEVPSRPVGCAAAFECDHEKTVGRIVTDCDEEECDDDHYEIVCSKCGRHFGWA